MTSPVVNVLTQGVLGSRRPTILQHTFSAKVPVHEPSLQLVSIRPEGSVPELIKLSVSLSSLRPPYFRPHKGFEQTVHWDKSTS